jgi:hypothetical protein
LTRGWSLWGACIALGGAPFAHAEDASCHVQIIVMPQPTAAPIDSAVLQALSDAAQVRLQLIRALGPRVYLLALSSAQDGPDCTAAIARLQADPRLLSVERDVRRQRQEQ